MKHKRAKMAMFYQNQMRKERKKREGINCEKCGWEIKKTECWVKSIELDDTEVIGVRRVDGRMELNCVGLTSDE